MNSHREIGINCTEYSIYTDFEQLLATFLQSGITLSHPFTVKWDCSWWEWLGGSILWEKGYICRTLLAFVVNIHVPVCNSHDWGVRSIPPYAPYLRLLSMVVSFSTRPTPPKSMVLYLNRPSFICKLGDTIIFALKRLVGTILVQPDLTHELAPWTHQEQNKRAWNDIQERVCY